MLNAKIFRGTPGAVYVKGLKGDLVAQMTRNDAVLVTQTEIYHRGAEDTKCTEGESQREYGKGVIASSAWQSQRDGFFSNRDPHVTTPVTMTTVY